VIVLIALAWIIGGLAASVILGALVGAIFGLAFRLYAWATNLYSDDEVHP
jgi:hypothetical protein